MSGKNGYLTTALMGVIFYYAGLVLLVGLCLDSAKYAPFLAAFWGCATVSTSLVLYLGWLSASREGVWVSPGRVTLDFLYILQVGTGLFILTNNLEVEFHFNITSPQEDARAAFFAMLTLFLGYAFHQLYIHMTTRTAVATLKDDPPHQVAPPFDTESHAVSNLNRRCNLGDFHYWLSRMTGRGQQTVAENDAIEEKEPLMGALRRAANSTETEDDLFDEDIEDTV